MFNFKSIKTKLLSAFSLVIILVILLGIYNFLVIMKSNQEARNIVEKELPLLIANQQMELTMANRISTARGYVLFGGDFKDRFNDYTEQGKEYEAVVRRSMLPRNSINSLTDIFAGERRFDTEVFQEYDKGNEEAAMRNLNASAGTIREIMAGYEKMAKDSQNTINEIEVRDCRKRRKRHCGSSQLSLF